MRSFVARACSLLLLLAAPAVVGCDCAAEDGPPVRRIDASSGDPDAHFVIEDAGDGDPCGDGFDGDRDGEVDEGCSCVPGEQQPCFRGEPARAGIGVCVRGMQDCASTGAEFGVWDICIGDGSPSAEVCDGVDNNCYGGTDEGCE